MSKSKTTSLLFALIETAAVLGVAGAMDQKPINVLSYALAGIAAFGIFYALSEVAEIMTRRHWRGHGQ